MKETIETKTADAILQNSIEVDIEGIKYQVSPPTTGTLILVSKLVSQMPTIKMDAENIIAESLAIAKDCTVVGDIIAVLILGEKNLKGTKTISKKRFWGLMTETTEVAVDKQAELAKIILENLSPKTMYDLAIRLLSLLEITGFFALSSSLIEVNLLKATRELEKMTRSGR